MRRPAGGTTPVYQRVAARSLRIAIRRAIRNGAIAIRDPPAPAGGENRAMEIFSPAFFSALAAIVVIDLALAGDNAIVIALAARGLPPRLAKRAIAWGTAGAVAVRSAMTLAVVWLLGIPGLMAAGGIVLAWVAWKLLLPHRGSASGLPAAQGFWAALRTIVVADAAMGLDNVLAVAGAAQGSFALVVAGLAISIPIVVWGSTLILKWIERHPWIVNVGVAVLAWTAGKMIVDEPLLQAPLARHGALPYILHGAVMAGVFAAGMLSGRRRAAEARA
jgi:YjbE family integral membrane protein